MIFNYELAVAYQEKCKSYLPSDKAIELIALIREVMHVAIVNNNELPKKLVLPSLVMICADDLKEAFRNLGYSNITILQTSGRTLVNIN